MADYDYGIDAGTQGLIGLASGIQGFAKGMMDAEDRNYKRMEMDAKLKAADEERTRNAFKDAIERRKQEQEAEDRREKQEADLYKEGLMRNETGLTERPLSAREKQKRMFEESKEGLIPKFGPSGEVIGYSVDPKGLPLQKAQMAAQADPFGLKTLQVQSAKAEIENKQRPTEGEGLSAGFAKRMQGAEAKLQEILGRGFDPTSYSTQAQGMIPEFAEGLKSGDVKAYEQAKRDFVSAVLRKESGAAISPSEFKNEERKYFPQTGDTPEVLANKALSRQQAFENLKAMSGRAWEKIPEVTPQGLVKGGLMQSAPQGLVPKIPDIQAKQKRLEELRRKAMGK